MYNHIKPLCDSILKIILYIIEFIHKFHLYTRAHSPFKHGSLSSYYGIRR